MGCDIFREFKVLTFDNDALYGLGQVDAIDKIDGLIDLNKNNAMMKYGKATGEYDVQVISGVIIIMDAIDFNTEIQRLIIDQKQYKIIKATKIEFPIESTEVFISQDIEEVAA